MGFRKTTSKKENEFSYNVIEKLGVLGVNGNYSKELRLISWNGREPVYDIRPWTVDQNGDERCGKGLTFSGEELESLLNILKTIDESDEGGDE